MTTDVANTIIIIFLFSTCVSGEVFSVNHPSRGYRATDIPKAPLRYHTSKLLMFRMHLTLNMRSVNVHCSLCISSGCRYSYPIVIVLAIY